MGDPDIASLSDEGFASFTAGLQPPLSQDDPTFWSVMGGFLRNAPTQFMEFASGHPVQSMWESAGDKAERTKEAIANKDYSTAFGTALSAMIPGSGDEAVVAGEEFGSGNTGAGAAHSLIALAPFLYRPAVQATPRVARPVGRAVTTTGKAIQGGTLGGLEAFLDAKKTGAPALIGSGLGWLMGGREGAMYGGALGAAPSTIRGVYRGARTAISPELPAGSPTPFGPFKTNPATARKMEFGGSAPPTYNPPGTNIPRGKWTPKPEAAPTPSQPKAPDPFKPNPATSRKMKYGGPAEPEYGPGRPQGPTGWTAPTEPLHPQGSPPPTGGAYTPPPRPPGQKFEVNPKMKAKMRFGGPTAQQSRSYGPPRRQSGRGMPKPPEEGMPAPPEETAGSSTVDQKANQVLNKMRMEAEAEAMRAKADAEQLRIENEQWRQQQQSRGSGNRQVSEHEAALLDQRAADAAAKNQRVAADLNARGISSSDFEGMPLDKQNAHIKQAHPGHRGYKPKSEIKSGREGRSAEQAIPEIVKALRDLERATGIPKPPQ